MRPGSDAQKAASIEEGWYVVSHDNDDSILRGPYEDASTAGAVRREMERQPQYDEANLWIVSEDYWNA